MPAHQARAAPVHFLINKAVVFPKAADGLLGRGHANHVAVEGTGVHDLAPANEGHDIVPADERRDGESGRQGLPQSGEVGFDSQKRV